ncbi:MAG: protein jag [Clostridia bacterium]|nr:protein jag [Clostridia bacterium]
MEEKNVFTAKSVDEALDEALKELNLTLDEVDYEILDEGKKGFLGLGASLAKIRIIPKADAVKRTGGADEGGRTCAFIDALLNIIGIKAESKVVSDGESLNVEIKTESSARVIGKRGDVLDAIQCLAGAVANTGREEYRKVVVDCENYRAQREQTLKDLALKVAHKAVETGRKVLLEPMTPYERRVIHAALMDSEEVKTASDGREPARYVVVIPNNAKPYDKGIRYGERRDRGNGRDRRRGDRRDRGERSGERRDRGGRGGRSGGGAKRGKKEIYFGTFLGNSNDTKNNEEK